MIKKNIVFSCYPEIKENFTTVLEKKKRIVDANKITPDDIKYYLRELFELYKDVYKTGDEILTNYVKGCILESINKTVNEEAAKIKVPVDSKSVKVGNILATADDKVREENEKLNKIEQDKILANKAINMAIKKIQASRDAMQNIEKTIINTINKDILNETTNKENSQEILKLARIGLLRTNSGSINKMVTNLGNNLLQKMRDNGMGQSADLIYDKFYKDNKDDLERLAIKKDNVLKMIDNVTENTMSLAKDESFCKNIESMVIKGSNVTKEEILSGKSNLLDNFFKCYTDLEIGSKISFGLVGLSVNESFSDLFTKAIDNWTPPADDIKKQVPMPEVQEAITIHSNNINQVKADTPKLFCFKTNDHFTCFTEVTVIDNGKTSILR